MRQPDVKKKTTKKISKKDTKKEVEQLEVKLITLTDFVEDNSKLISTLGVFTALTVFSTNLPLKPFGYTLSFAFMTLSVLLWLELWAKFPSQRGNWRLTWFENILFYTVLAIIFYWLLDFRSIWKDFLIVLLFGVVLALIAYPIRKYNIFNRLFNTEPGKLKFLRYLLGIILGLLVAYFAITIANILAPGINQFLDQLNQTMSTNTP